MQDAPTQLHETLTSASSLNVVAAGRYKALKNQDYPAHFHTTLEVVIFQTGLIQCLVGEDLPLSVAVNRVQETIEVPWNGSDSSRASQVITTRPGLVLVMPPHTIHADRALTAYSHHYLLLDLNGAERLIKKPIAFMDDFDRNIEHVMKRIVREWQARAPHREPMLQLLLQQLQIHSQRLETDPTPSSAEQLVRRAERLLEENVSNAQSIAQLASALNVSPSALRSHFAKLRSYSPKSYQQQLRLNRALELIRGSSLPLEDIAGLTGYDSASHLSRHIKSSTGMTPGGFRERGDLR